MIGAVPVGLRYLAALILLGFLPGWVWLQAYFPQPEEIVERLVLAVGLSLALTVFAATFAVYLPGPLSPGHLLLTSNTLIVIGLIAGWRRQRARSARAALSLYLTALVLLLLLAAAVRLPRLGYAEFHEDEAEALMLGVRLFQGEDYAIFLHRKGPAQMLIPVTFWLLAGRINETLARFPFALSSILSVATLFFMGRRWFNWLAGIAAGLLWAVNGYAIGFGRMVQYQALIFFLGPLAIYLFYLAWEQGQIRLQIPAAILLAACLLAHFDALLLLPAAAYLIWLMAREPRHRWITGLALTLFLALLASFYVPYFLDPEFKNTVAYLSESRVRPGLLYNNLNLLQGLDKDYSSHFYLPAVGLGLISFIIWQGGRVSPRWRWLMAGLGLLSISSWWLSDLWQVGSLNLGIAPWFLLGLILVWFSPTIALRTAWLMVGIPLLGYVFLVDDPRTHLYIMYPGALLLAGAGWSVLVSRWSGWKKRGDMMPPANRPSFQFAKLPGIVILAAGIILSGLILVYDIAIFLQTASTLAQLRQTWEGSGWKIIYNDLPQERGYFGYPKREGWKVIGTLRAQGEFPGDFRSMNEDFIVPIWYNYGQARSCYNTPAHFFVRATKDESLPVNDPYAETGQVQREGEVRLRIFSARADPQARPAIYSLENYEATFDQQATPAQFAQQAEPEQWVGAQFGPAIKFRGYDLPRTTVTAGDVLYLDLYWQALANPGDNYRAFVHLTDGTTLWGQQDDDPTCRLPTSIWRPGQRGIGQFRLPINPETPPGRYPLIIGLYQADTLERLPITAGAGQVGDDFLWLRDIEVVNPVPTE